MSVTVFTGVPGAGKTAALVDELRRLAGSRPLYVHGLDGLKLPHEKLDPERWHLDVPDGALIVIDEAQTVWRPRGSGSKVPAHIAELETHRHKGIDFLITTQHPGLLDSNVRALVGRHVHIRNIGLLGRHWYEWPELGSVTQYAKAPVQRRYRLPRAAFDLYTSASIHTKQATPIPKGLVLLVVCLLAVVGGGWYMKRSMDAKLQPLAAITSSGAATALPSIRQGATGAAVASRWPVYDAVAPKPRVDALEGRALQFEGSYTVGSKRFATFGLLIDGQRVATVRLSDLVNMGYTFTELGPCAAVLASAHVERLITCGKPSAAVAPPVQASADAGRLPGALPSGMSLF